MGEGRKGKLQFSIKKMLKGCFVEPLEGCTQLNEGNYIFTNTCHHRLLYCFEVQFLTRKLSYRTVINRAYCQQSQQK